MTDLIPAPRPVESREDRMRHATAAPYAAEDAAPQQSFATYLDASERDQLDARAATAEQERDDALDDRDNARRERDTALEVARSNKRHVAYLTAVIDAIANVEPHIHNGDVTEATCSPYCPGCRIRTAMNTTIDAPTPGLGSPADRAQDDLSWRRLDPAPIDSEPMRCRTRYADPTGLPHRCFLTCGHTSVHEWKTERS